MKRNRRGPPAILLSTVDQSTVLRLRDPPLPAIPRLIVSHASVDAPPTPQPVADRLATVGMLAAGLGHDMGNLLPIIRLHLDALQLMNLPEAALQDVRAISDACDYLKHLSRGLRLFVLQPETPPTTADRTDLALWWSDVAPFMRNALPRGVLFVPSLFPDLPTLAISAHALTQAVYNLVQNAGDSMAARASGHVWISATCAPHTRRVVLSVSDDGPGMTPEILRRCMEPYFSTKPGGASSGLGLALVHNAIEHAGGSITIRSLPGVGTNFLLTLPMATPALPVPLTIAQCDALAGGSHITCSKEPNT